MTGAEGVRAELREAAEQLRDAGPAPRITIAMADLLAVLDDRDALAEQVAQAEQRAEREAADHRDEVRELEAERNEWCQRALERADALARAEQREARVREALNLAFPIANDDASTTVAVVRVKHLLAALNEGDTDDQQQ